MAEAKQIEKPVNSVKLEVKTEAKPVAERIPISFQLGDVVIDGAVIKPMTFQSFADYVAEAQSMVAPKTFEGRLRRVRMGWRGRR